MFTSKKEIDLLQKRIEELEKNNQELELRHQNELRLLRQQFASFLIGYPPTPEAVSKGLNYSEIPKEQVSSFIKNTFDLLILDVRSDEGWANGYIPHAKHIPAAQVFTRLQELADKNRPILTICANGNTGLTVAQTLAKEGYKHVYNALGGMAGYKGGLEKPEIQKLDENAIQGKDRSLIRKVIEILDRDVRPGLKRDGGDLSVVAVEEGVVKIKMVGACVGCGSQKRTVEDGIKNHLMKMLPEIQGIEDLSLG